MFLARSSSQFDWRSRFAWGIWNLEALGSPSAGKSSLSLIFRVLKGEVHLGFRALSSNPHSRTQIEGRGHGTEIEFLESRIRVSKP